MAATAPILISGSGLCGLLVARALATHKIPFIVYERDQSFTQRAQGYRLRMSTFGLDAIKSILPKDAWEEFYSGVSITSGGNSGMNVVDAITGEKSSGNPPPSQDNNKENSKSENKSGSAPNNGLMKGLGPKGEVYGVSRGYLRSSLIKTIEDKVEYGKQVTGYTSTDSGVVAHFQDGSSSPEGSMLIGTDGVHSAIAKQVSKGALKLYDTKARMIHGQTSTSAFKFLGEGVFAITDETRPNDEMVRVICNVRPKDMNDPNVSFGWTMACSPGVLEPPGNRYQVVGKQAADMSLELTKNWKEEIRQIFVQQDVEEAGFWKMTCSTPEGVPHWESDPRVTLAGDSVHSMTPAGGNGANTALVTASILGKMLREHQGWQKNIVSNYEEKMRENGTENVKLSIATAQKMFRLKDLVEDHSVFRNF